MWFGPNQTVLCMSVLNMILLMLCNRLVLCVRLYLGQKHDLIIGLVYYTWILRFLFLKVSRLSWKSTKL